MFILGGNESKTQIPFQMEVLFKRFVIVKMPMRWFEFPLPSLTVGLIKALENVVTKFAAHMSSVWCWCRMH